MIKVGQFLRLDCRPGKEKEVEKFLRDAQMQIEEETRTAVWYALKLSPSSFGIFGGFVDGESQQVHLSGHVSHALQAKTTEWLTHPPVVDKFTVIAGKK